MERTVTTEASVETAPHEHYEYELGNATRVTRPFSNPYCK